MVINYIKKQLVKSIFFSLLTFLFFLNANGQYLQQKVKESLKSYQSHLLITLKIILTKLITLEKGQIQENIKTLLDKLNAVD